MIDEKTKPHNEDRGLSMSEAELMELMEFNDEYAAQRSAEKRRLAEEKAKLTLNAMKFDEVLKLAKGIEDDPKARKRDEWRATIGFIGAKKKEERAFDFLLAALEKAETPMQRKVVHEALKNWSGTDKGPSDYQADSAIEMAIEDWKAWRRGRPIQAR